MKLTGSPHRTPVRTHLYAFATGTFLSAAWLVFLHGERATEEAAENLAANAAAQAAAREALRQRDQAALREMAVAPPPPSYSPSGTERERELYRAGFNARCDAHAKKLRELTSLSETFREVPDLGPPLTQAAFTGDSDQAAALFLEWLRRDPAAAFQAVESRQRLLAAGNFEGDNSPFRAASGAIRTDDMLAYLKLHPKLGAQTYHLPQAFVAALAEKDDLASLDHVLSAVSEDIRNSLVIPFAEAWDSKDPSADARTIAGSPVLRSELAYHVFDHMGYFGSPELRNAILAQSWPGGEDDKERLTSRWKSGPANSLTFQSDGDPPPEPRSKNYAALVEDHRMTVDAVRAAMQAASSEGKETPAELDERVCTDLLSSDPGEVAAWALHHGLAEEKLRNLADRSANPWDGRRTARIQRALAGAGLPPPPSGTMGEDSSQWSRGLRFWLRTNPDAATAALGSFPPTWRQAATSPAPAGAPAER